MNPRAFKVMTVKPDAKILDGVKVMGEGVELTSGAVMVYWMLFHPHAAFFESKAELMRLVGTHATFVYC